MSWKNIKNFMIVLLIIACGIIAFMLLSQNRAEDSSEAALDEAVKLLGKSGITVDRELLIGSFDGMKTYRFTTDHEYPERISRKLAAGNVTDIFSVPDGIEIHTDKNERIFFGEDFYISYEADSAVKITEADLHRLFSAECKAPVFSSTEEKNEIYGNKKLITLTQTVSGVPIPENSVECTFIDGNLTEFDGKWCFPDMCSTFSSQLRDYLSIIFNERERLGETGENKRELKIKKLENCYGIEKNSNQSVIILLPSLYIEYTNGEHAVHSAVVD